jgi:hypothetical protein
MSTRDEKLAARAMRIARRQRKSKRKKALLIKKAFKKARKADRNRQSGG